MICAWLLLLSKFSVSIHGVVCIHTSLLFVAKYIVRLYLFIHSLVDEPWGHFRFCPVIILVYKVLHEHVSNFCEYTTTSETGN